MEDEMDEVVGEFLVESYEGLDRLDRDLIDLEQDPTSREILASIFRTMHTIKGTCGFLGFRHLEGVAHVAENLLALLRDGKVSVDREITDALLRSVDAVRFQLAGIEATGDEPAEPHTELCQWLERLQDPARPATASVPEDAAPPEAAVVEDDTVAVDAAIEPAVEAMADAPLLGEILPDVGAEPADVTLALAEQDLGDTRKIGEIMVAHGTTAAAQVDAALAIQQAMAGDLSSDGAGADLAGGGVTDTTIRVDVAILDQLMTLVGELVLARNQILQLSGQRRDPDLLAPAQRLNLITSELQEGVMKTRMQPIGNVWRKFPRVVRDLSGQIGKQVKLRMDGAETELDRTVLEAIKDPLTHLVRNAIDHGIESPDQRVAAGKHPEGTLLLRSYHESGKVNIEIADDGAGIDADKIRLKAVERGLLSAEEAARTSDREILNYIFAPGFSTATQVTNISGRGVGMDVVKTNIEKIGGTVELQTEPGQGTTFKVKIPLTLAIIPALVVLGGGYRYVIPQINLLELVRLEGAEARRGIELVHGAPVYRLRGRLLPLVSLGDVLGGGNGLESLRRRADEAPIGRDVVNIVVLQADEHQFGLVVDSVNDTQEIVVKPLSRLVNDVNIFAGSTIMGDGKISLILDVIGIARRAGVIGENRERARLSEYDEPVDETEQTRTMLVVDVAGAPAAIALSDVARLEQFPRAALERARGADVVQYRGEILPLVDLASALGRGWSESADEALLEVVVYRYRGHSVGIVVGAILDIVEQAVGPCDEHAVVGGSIVVAGRVTDVVNVENLVRSSLPGLEPVSDLDDAYDQDGFVLEGHR